MARGWGAAVGAAVAVVLVAVVVAGVVAARRSGTAAEEPGSTGGAVGDTGTTSTTLPSPDDSYWSPERMRDAEPAPMPPR